MKKLETREKRPNLVGLKKKETNFITASDALPLTDEDFDIKTSFFSIISLIEAIAW